MTNMALHRQQTGAVLITSLIFMLVLTVIALVANQSTMLETRMSTNTVFTERALESSEAVRTGTDDLLDAHLFHRGWPIVLGGSLADDLFNLPDGISTTNILSWGEGNSASEDIHNSSTLVKDVKLRIDGNGDGDYEDDVDQHADLYVYKTIVGSASGSATAMVAGYEGLGKSSASGSARIYFDLRAVGTASGDATGVTGSNFRYVVRN